MLSWFSVFIQDTGRFGMHNVSVRGRDNGWNIR